MKTLLKIVLGLVVALVVLIVAAIIIVPMLVDPNDFKAPLVENVKEETGRDLRIEGDLELTVFPWLGVKLGKTELGNAPGFEEPFFARMERVAVRLKIMPLLSREIVLDTVTLHGLEVNLARDANGHTNWDDLATAGKGGEGAEETPSREGDEGGAQIAGLALGGLDIRDGRITWRDDQAGQKFTVSEIRAVTGAISAGEPVALDVALQVQGGPPALDATLELGAELLADLEARVFTVRALVLDIEAKGEGLPGGALALELRTDAEVDLGSQVATLSGLSLALGDLSLSGGARAEKILGEPTYTATLDLAEFNPKKLLESLTGEPLETTDPKALTALAAKLQVAGSAKTVTVSPLSVRLDESTLGGRLEVVDLARSALRFELELDRIDADRYMPPPAEGAAEPAAPASPGAASSAISVEPLRGLDVAGTAKVGELKVAKLTMTDVGVKVLAKGGRLELNPVSAKLYEGTYAGNIQLDGRSTPVLTVDERLAGVQVGLLLADMQGEDRLTGTTEATAKLRMTGADTEAMTKSLTGKVRFDFRDGAVKGFNVNQLLREAKAKLTGQGVGAAEGPDQTDFSELGGTIDFQNGVATNPDLLAKSPFLRVDGEGQASLVAETIDYRITATLVGTSAGQGGKELTELAGVPVPIKVGGTFSEPTYGLDFEKLAAAFAKSKGAAALGDAAGKITEQATEKAKASIGKIGGDAAGSVGGEAAEKAAGAIKGLLGR